MNVLVIGDEHTYGFGLSGGNLSFVGHFIRQVSRAGQPVSVEAYAHLTMAQMSSTLAQLPLSRFDLIVLQLDHRIIQPAVFDSVNVPCLATPALPQSLTLQSRDTEAGQLSSFKAMSTLLRSFVRSRDKMALSVLLKQLRPFRHNVLILTPFPNRDRINQWVRQRSRNLLLQEAENQLFSVFDSDLVIRPEEEYFLANDPQHLNAISHELLGHSLFDFYLSAPTIVTIQAIRRYY
ncbi:SGNH/GDSL hydrolase family protein [Spirosoma sp. KCTC 42546]|uniref:SGNH/GDSL hydrolase family protein n=1 Tax=Spirosoma sp. KCTC 42546 TaxID=2520506 RepID=UPI00115A6F63|nr:SGNH/GDSL hydrolase family protein [Spirosoma sp. KCTC 42546]QDK79122.1 SGNH/GDSL hydrolase family protein [Spirosoma sp. KCTC 42546]